MEINGIYIDVSSKSQKNWIEKYRNLEEYYKKYGNIDVSQGYEIDGIKLGTWLREQRKAYYGKGECKITREKIELLDLFGIKWDIREEKWKQKFNLLKKYKTRYGDTNISENYEINGVKLGRWLATQRRAYNGKGNLKLTQNQKYLLNDLDVDWNPVETRCLNKEITDNNKEKYYEIVERRINHILDDLMYERINEIEYPEFQEEIETIVIKRLFR